MWPVINILCDIYIKGYNELFFFGIIIYTLKIFVVQNSCNGGTKNPYVGSQFIGGEN